MRIEYASGSPKPAAHHDRELSDVGERRELCGRGHAEGIGIAIEVEAANGGKADPLVERGPRRPGKDFDAVAEGNQLSGQVTGVDTLAATARVAPVDEEGDAEFAGLSGRAGMRSGTTIVLLSAPEAFVAAMVSLIERDTTPLSYSRRSAILAYFPVRHKYTVLE